MENWGVGLSAISTSGDVLEARGVGRNSLRKVDATPKHNQAQGALSFVVEMACHGRIRVAVRLSLRRRGVSPASGDGVDGCEAALPDAIESRVARRSPVLMAVACYAKLAPAKEEAAEGRWG